MKITAIYPGTFDPITNGHVDIIQRAQRLFDHLIVAVAQSARKRPLLSLEQRVELARAVTAEYQNVSVCSFEGLAIELARQKKATVIVRGIRSGGDFDYELQLSGMNGQLAPEIETVLLIPRPEVQAISATLVREIAAMNGDISAFVDARVAKVLYASVKDEYSKK